MLRIWDAVQSWRLEKSSRKLYWCRAGPACLHINVFIPGDESKGCMRVHPPVHSEGFRQPPRCTDVWAFWQELSTDEYDLLDRIVETKNYGDLLAFVLERVSLLLDLYLRSLFLAGYPCRFPGLTALTSLLQTTDCMSSPFACRLASCDQRSLSNDK